MHRRSILGMALAGLAMPVVALPLLAPSALAQNAPALDTPLAAVQRVYAPGVKDAQRPYSKKLRGLYAAAITKSRELNEPVSGIDFDPITGSQDADDDFRKTLKYATRPASAGKAVVEVKLKVFKTEPEKTILYDLVLDGRDWKIDDISSPAKGDDGWRLSTQLIAGAKGQ
jgi:hypothetical protein